MERDILLERLEKKLAEKEKEVEELRKMLSSKTLEELKEELRGEFKKEIKSIEAKIAELSKSVEALMNEVLFIKSELKTQGKKKDIVEIAEKKNVEEKPKKKQIDYDEGIIVID